MAKATPTGMRQSQRASVGKAMKMAAADTNAQSPLGAPRKKSGTKKASRPSRQGQRGVMSLNARGC